MIVGRGLEEDKIKKLAADMNLGNSVRFLGIRSDVSELLNAFDMFVLPSKYEGLPVVLLKRKQMESKNLYLIELQQKWI